jgi:hypothetical protein
MPQPPNLQKMLQQAQQMQEEMLAAQEALKNEKVETTAGGGRVKVVVTGEGRIESLAIDPDAVDPEDVEMLQDLVLAAVNEALRQAEELREKAMSGATGFDPMSALGDLGGLGGLLGGGGPGGGVGGPPPNRAARRKQR